MAKCGFEKAWVGLYQNEAPCAEHQSKVCCSCGKPAICECGETGQFVCGAPLCADCEHAIFPDGTNGGVGFNAMSCPEIPRTHIPRKDQKFKPWYVQETEKRGIVKEREADHSV